MRFMGARHEGLYVKLKLSGKLLMSAEPPLPLATLIADAGG